MRDFAAVWKWTVEEKMGIFSPSPERGTQKLNEHRPPVHVKQHLLLIKVGGASCHMTHIVFMIILLYTVVSL